MQDILDYLAMFAEDTSAGGNGSADSAHPALVVVDAFHTEELAATNFSKIKNFLEDACRVLGKPFTSVDLTATSFCNFDLFSLHLFFTVCFPLGAIFCC